MCALLIRMFHLSLILFASTSFLVILIMQWQPKQKKCVEFVSFKAVAEKKLKEYLINFISFPLIDYQ